MNEDELLGIVAEYFPREGQGLVLGRGDDCAVISGGGNLAVSTDIFCENSHFRRAYFSPGELGHKCLAVNLSDLAAAGAKPLGFTLGMTLTGQEDQGWLREFCKGMAGLAERHGVLLTGGDLARGEQLSMCPTVWGSVEGKGLMRGQGKPGDVVFCLGTLGLARGGLMLLEAEMQKAEPDFQGVRKEFPQSTGQHLTPEPLCRQGKVLARLGRNWPGISLMDVSDGLARDLPRLLGKNEGSGKRLGAELTLEQADLQEETIRIAELLGCDPTLFAFEGGEDYALLGSCPPEAWPALREALPQARRLGNVREEEGLCLNGKPVTLKGFDHFA